MPRPAFARVFAGSILAATLTSAAVLAAPLTLAPDHGTSSPSHQAIPVQMHQGHHAGLGWSDRDGRPGASERVDRVEGRVAFLKAELKITDAQAKFWEPVAKAMRDQSAALKALHEQRPQRTQAERDRALSAPEVLARREEETNLHAKVLAAQAAGQKQFATVFVSLYNQMSDEQKKTADSLLNRHGRGPRR